MLNDLRTRLTFANVTSVVALFVALGGSATAAVLINGKNIKAGTIAGKAIKANTIGSDKITNGSLLSQDFKAGQLPAGARGPDGPQGGQGPQGAAGANGVNGQDGATGPSDIYAAGVAGGSLSQVTTTSAVVIASITVPSGSYLLGAKTNLALVPASQPASAFCRLASPSGGAWDYVNPTLSGTDPGPKFVSLAGADTFATPTVVTFECYGTDGSAYSYTNARVWAIKTGSLHAPALPLPSD
jgi:hypothetical protein